MRLQVGQGIVRRLFSDGISEKYMELNTALRETIRKNGKSVLADANMLKAHLADLAPDQSRTISVLCQASAAHIFDRLAVCEESETESELRMALL